MAANAWEGFDLPIEDQPHLLDRHGPLFITGCPRSGTTFLSGAINAIPTIEQFNGVLAPPRMMHRIGQRYAAGESVEQQLQIMRDVFWNAFVRRCTFFNERVGAVARARRGLLALARPGTIEGRTMLYKEPFIAFAMEPIVAHFESSRILHIVRDGRDNADSLDRSYRHALSDEVLSDPFLSAQKNSEIGPFHTIDGFNYPWWVAEDEREFFRASSKYVRNVMMWREMTQRIVEAGRNLPPARYLQIRYEDMIHDREGAARAISGFLGGSPLRHLHRGLKDAHEQSIGVHRRNQSTPEIDAANRVAGPLLEQLGFA